MDADEEISKLHENLSQPYPGEALDTYIEKLIKEETEKECEEKNGNKELEQSLQKEEEEESLPEEEIQEETEPSHSGKDFQSQTTLLHDIVVFLDWIFSPKIMMRMTVVFAFFLVMSQCYHALLEAMSRPTILKPRQSRPFFSNSSSKYVHDFYTGHTKPDILLRKTDLLIVMYYAPWSTLSVFLKHPYEVVAKFLHVPGRVSFTGVNCWSAGSLCRSSYKLMNYPVIAAYSGGASVMYTGPPETDHLYRWVIRLQNHVIPVNTKKRLEEIQSTYQSVLIGYYPFKRLEPSNEYKAFAAAGFMLASGNPQDETIAVCVTYSLEIAKQLNLRFEGDIQLIRASGETVAWPLGRQRTALNIMDFARKQSLTAGQLRFISRPQDIVQNDQVYDLLDHSPVLFLITRLEPMYHQQDEIILFSQISQDYWKCSLEILAQEPVVYIKSRMDGLTSDSSACNAVNLDQIALDNCCRSQLHSVDWNIACSSGTKYRWEDEEASQKRRNHWTEEVLSVQPQCASLRVMPADQLIQSCCSIYDKIVSPYVTPVQRILAHEKLQNEERNLLKRCIRFKLAQHFEYKMTTTVSPFTEDTNMSTTIQGLACKKNDSLQFAVIDSNSAQYFLTKWGITEATVPLLVLVDTAKELFVVMKEEVNQTNTQRLIHDFHGNLLNDYMLDENAKNSKFNKKLDMDTEFNIKVKSQQQITRLTRKSFLTLVDNENSTVDQVVFFTGGGWHGASTSVLFNIYSLKQYFSRAEELIKFYTIDVTKNELPYNFNFESVPSIVLFLAGRRDVSWKYPEMLPITTPNLISFIVSRCSPILRWKMSLLNCDRICLLRNSHKLRRSVDKVQRELRSLINVTVEHPEKLAKWKQSKIRKLLAMRSVLRVISTGTHADDVNEIVIDRLLKSEHVTPLFSKSTL